MTNVYNVKQRVIFALMQHPEARDSDELLISIIDEGIRPEVKHIPYSEVMRNRNKYGLPSCESIRRCRQKVQAEYSELCGSKKVQQYREEKRKEYEEFARSLA